LAYFEAVRAATMGVSRQAGALADRIKPLELA